MTEAAKATTSDFDLTTIGGRIAAARTDKKMSAAALAKQIGKSRAAISLYETGRNTPPQSVVEQIAQALGRSPIWLSYGTEGPSLSELARSLEGQTFRAPMIEANGGEIDIMSQIHAADSAIFLSVRSVERLQFDAATFGLRAGDLLLLSSAPSGISPDGKLYAIETLTGSAIVKSGPIYAHAGAGGGTLKLKLTAGDGETFESTPDQLVVLGKVVGWIHREP